MDVLKATKSTDNTFSGVTKSSQNQNSSEVNTSKDFGKQTTNDKNMSERLNKLTDELNQQMDALNTNIKFGFNSEIDSMYIKVTEKNTGRVIRQIPSEEAMRLTAYLKDAIGVIFDKES